MAPDVSVQEYWQALSNGSAMEEVRLQIVIIDESASFHRPSVQQRATSSHHVFHPADNLKPH